MGPDIVLQCKQDMCSNCCNMYQQILVKDLNLEFQKNVLGMYTSDVVKNNNANFLQIAQCTVACEDAYYFDPDANNKKKAHIDKAYNEVHTYIVNHDSDKFNDIEEGEQGHEGEEDSEHFRFK